MGTLKIADPVVSVASASILPPSLSSTLPVGAGRTESADLDKPPLTSELNTTGWPVTAGLVLDARVTLGLTAAATLVPLSVAVTVPDAVPTDRVAERAPAAAGLKITLMVQFEPPARVVPQV